MQIRFANADELALLPAIERAAAALFSLSVHPDMADATLASEHLESSDVVFVAEESNVLAGFAIVRPYRDAMHIQEIDVHPQFARRGVGAKLIQSVADWTRAQGIRAVTLTTFDDVPWNGPYYARLGFNILSLDSLRPSLQSIRRAEAQAGLPMSHRICMEMNLLAT